MSGGPSPTTRQASTTNYSPSSFSSSSHPPFTHNQVVYFSFPPPLSCSQEERVERPPFFPPPPLLTAGSWMHAARLGGATKKWGERRGGGMGRPSLSLLLAWGSFARRDQYLHLSPSLRSMMLETERKRERERERDAEDKTGARYENHETSPASGERPFAARLPAKAGSRPPRSRPHSRPRASQWRRAPPPTPVEPRTGGGPAERR